MISSVAGEIYARATQHRLHCLPLNRPPGGTLWSKKEEEEKIKLSILWNSAEELTDPRHLLNAGKQLLELTDEHDLFHSSWVEVISVSVYLSREYCDPKGTRCSIVQYKEEFLVVARAQSKLSSDMNIIKNAMPWSERQSGFGKVNWKLRPSKNTHCKNKRLRNSTSMSNSSNRVEESLKLGKLQKVKCDILQKKQWLFTFGFVSMPFSQVYLKSITSCCSSSQVQ